MSWAWSGSMRSPLCPGGGVVFGPKPKYWSIKINWKEKRLAISTAVNAIVVKDFGDKLEKPKTKEFIMAFKQWRIDPKEKSTFMMMDVMENLVLLSRNIRTLKILTPRTLNLFDILNADKLVPMLGAVDFLNEHYGIDFEGKSEEDDKEYAREKSTEEEGEKL